MPILLFLSSTIPVHAGFFSFLENLLWKDGDVSQTALVANSQTISLLDAPVNINPMAGVGGVDINIVEESAIASVSGPLGSLADAIEEHKKSDQIIIYVVREGDNLSQIAKLFGVTTNTIIWANDITRSDLIKPGQELVILPISGIKYAVKSGDTFEGIAKKFKGDAMEIMEFNGVYNESELAVGDEIIIPNGEMDAPKYVINTYQSSSSSQYSGYYIRPINGGRKTQGIHGYNGVDLANYCGSPVVASASGEVIISKEYGWNAGAGKYIVVRHSNNTQTLYAHLSDVIVAKGWHVVQGQVIGYVGSTGLSTGCHIHFEIRGVNAPRNPF